MMARRLMGRGGGGLIPTPSSPPAIGDELAGGFYTGAAWDTVTTGTATIDMAWVEFGQPLTLAIPDESTAAHYYPTTKWPFYVGQLVRLAPIENTAQVFIDATVVSRSTAGLRVLVTSKTGTTGSFSDWVIAARWKVILAPKTGGESTKDLRYKIDSTKAPAECVTLTNGRAATAAMIAANTAAGSVIYPAADFIRSVNDAALSGYTDWEFPARDWLELMWRNLKPVTLNNFIAARSKENSYIRDANSDDIVNEGRGLNRHSVPPGGAYTTTTPAQTPLVLFRSGGAQAPPWEIHFWSSSECSAPYAWFQYYTTANPGYQIYHNKTNSLRVRAVRRSIL